MSTITQSAALLRTHRRLGPIENAPAVFRQGRLRLYFTCTRLGLKRVHPPRALAAARRALCRRTRWCRLLDLCLKDFGDHGLRLGEQKLALIGAGPSLHLSRVLYGFVGLKLSVGSKVSILKAIDRLTATSSSVNRYNSFASAKSHGVCSVSTASRSYRVRWPTPKFMPIGPIISQRELSRIRPWLGRSQS